MFFSVVPVNLQLGCSLDEFGDAVAAKERPGTLPASGRRLSKLLADQKPNLDKPGANPPLNGLWLRG